MTCLMSVCLTFIEHMSLGVAFSFGWMGVLFRTHGSVKLSVVKPLMQSVLTTSCLSELYSRIQYCE
jgi:hypothetical protein